ncbi:MAG: response regulator transcription factor [Tepidiformaceae bacterium]
MDDPFPGTAPLRILVSAAYPALRAGLRAMLDGAPGMRVVGEFATVSESAEVDLSAADVLVANVQDESAIAALLDLAEGTPIVFLADEPTLYQALEEATPVPRALLLQGASAEELAAAVSAVATGLLVADPAVASALRERHGSSVRAESGRPVAALSGREVDVLTLVASGLPNKTIALRLGISDHTVKFHVGSILGKLGAASRSEAVAMAVRSGLLPL